MLIFLKVLGIFAEIFLDAFNVLISMLFVIFDELLEVCRFVIEVDLRLSALLKSSLHAVFNPTCHLRLDFFDSPMKPRCEVLHFEETLIDERLPLPDVNVLPDKRISN